MWDSYRKCWRWSVICLGNSVLGFGCAQGLGRELEVLFQAESSPTLLLNSALVDVFGRAILQFFNT